MKETFYPTLEEALYLHRRLIEKFGGASGIIDKGLLDSALARPRSGYYGSLSEQAAALLQSLACNHAFVDGNKRAAFALTAVFTRLNGYSLLVDPAEGLFFIERTLITERASLQAITKWLEVRMRPCPQPK